MEQTQRHQLQANINHQCPVCRKAQQLIGKQHINQYQSDTDNTCLNSCGKRIRTKARTYVLHLNYIQVKRQRACTNEGRKLFCPLRGKAARNHCLSVCDCCLYGWRTDYLIIHNDINLLTNIVRGCLSKSFRPLFVELQCNIGLRSTVFACGTNLLGCILYHITCQQHIAVLICKGKLRGLSDFLNGFLRILHTGNLHADTLVPLTGNLSLCPALPVQSALQKGNCCLHFIVCYRFLVCFVNDIYTATQIKTLLNAMNTQCLFGTNPLIGDCTQRNRHNECQQKHHSAFHLHLFSPSFHAVFLRKKGMNLSLFSVSGRIHAPLFRLSQNLF